MSRTAFFQCIDQSVFRRMKYECNRMYSFESASWPNMEIEPQHLAEAGFFYLKTADKVQCPFCGLIKYNWMTGANPLREHIRNSPRCPFMLGSDAGNVPRFNKSSNSSCIVKHPRMWNLELRLRTYLNWPLRFLTPKNLADCGFYYTGVSDFVKCFYCDGTLGNWKPNDIPWEEHKKHFPHCAYSRLCILKKNFSQEISNGQHSIVDSKPVNHCSLEGGYEVKQNTLASFGKNNNDDILLECKICMTKERSLVFQPCGHLVTCWDCGQLVKNCPICRKTIKKVIKIYFS